MFSNASGEGNFLTFFRLFYPLLKGLSPLRGSPQENWLQKILLRNLTKTNYAKPAISWLKNWQGALL